MTIDTYLTYLALSFVIISVPGPNVTLILAASTLQGARAGVWATAGIALAMTVQTAAVGLGLTWLVQRFSGVFEIIRYLGAAYLIWLGIQAWRHARAPVEAAPKNLNILRRGFLVGLANPKSLTFFAAFFPQFIVPQQPAAPQLAMLAAGFIILALLVNLAYSFAGGIGNRFVKSARARLWLNRGSGLSLIGGGAVLAGIHRA